MWPLLKSKRKVFLTLPLFFLASCTSGGTVYKSPPLSVQSPVPVTAEVSKELKDYVRIERIVVVPSGDNYVIQLSLRNLSDAPLNVLYKVELYNSQGLKVDFLTSAWTALELDSNGERVVKVVVPKRVVGKLSSVKVYLKTFERGG